MVFLSGVVHHDGAEHGVELLAIACQGMTAGVKVMTQGIRSPAMGTFPFSPPQAGGG
jgi:hypothetical protein